MAFIIPNAVDTTSGNRFEAIDQSEPDSLDFEILGKDITGVVAGCEVTTNNSTTTVAVSSGVVAIEGVSYTVAANPALALPAAPADNRFDLIVARVSGGSASLVVVSGENSSTNPTYPKSSNVVTGSPTSSNVNLSTDCVLAAVYRSGSTTITSARIIDKRKVISTGVYNQGSGAPSGALGLGTGSLYFDTNPQSGTNSGVYVKLVNGTWASLALNVGSHLPVGALVAWPTKATVPDGFVSADGQLLNISGNEALFSVYGTEFGGDGVTTFGVPNYNDGYSLKGTTVLSNIGSTVGSDSVTLSVSNLPSHTHSLSSHTHTLSHTHGITHTHTASTNPTGSHIHDVTGSTASDSHSHYMGVGLDELFVYIHGDGRSSYISQQTGISLANVASAHPGFDAVPYHRISGGTWQDSLLTRSDSHTHSLNGSGAETTSAGSHSHTVTVNNATGSTTSQSGSVTTGPSVSDTGSVGSGTSISVVSKSRLVRWLIRSSVGDSADYIGSSGSMSAYVPTLTNVTDAANIDAYWNELGGFVNFRVEFDFDGSTSSSGEIAISTPTTMADAWDVLSFTGALYDATDGSYKPIRGRVDTTTTFKLEDVVNGGAVSDGSPITFASGDKVVISGQYRSVPA